jgi:hypothetical protein
VYSLKEQIVKYIANFGTYIVSFEQVTGSRYLLGPMFLEFVGYPAVENTHLIYGDDSSMVEGGEDVVEPWRFYPA